MNFTEWTNQLVAALKAKEEALIRYSYAEELQHRAYYEYPQDSAINEFAHRAYKEALKVYDARCEEYKALMDEKVSNVTDSKVPAGDDGSVTDDHCKHCGYGFYDCNCDLCEIEGHKWSPVYRVDDGYFRSCESCGLEQQTGRIVRATSWRQQIVDDAIREEESR